MCKAIAQLPNLSTLRVRGAWLFGPSKQDAERVMPAVSAIAAASTSLRHLHLTPGPALMAVASGLSQWTGLTRLDVCKQVCRYEAEQYSWAAQLGQVPGLRWLSVPHGALQAGWGWLGSLQQLRVLAVDCGANSAFAEANMIGDTEWLEGCSPAALPPQLQVLGVSGLKSEQSAGQRVRRRLQQLLGGRGCELVLAVGVDLGEVAGPTQQLTGVPEVLQQVLA